MPGLRLCGVCARNARSVAGPGDAPPCSRTSHGLAEAHRASTGPGGWREAPWASPSRPAPGRLPSWSIADLGACSAWRSAWRKGRQGDGAESPGASGPLRPCATPRSPARRPATASARFLFSLTAAEGLQRRGAEEVRRLLSFFRLRKRGPKAFRPRPSFAIEQQKSRERYASLPTTFPEDDLPAHDNRGATRDYAKRHQHQTNDTLLRQQSDTGLIPYTGSDGVYRRPGVVSSGIWRV
jgi:hypothetical protein